MAKIFKKCIVAVLVSALLLLSSACMGVSLDAPQDLTVDIENRLTWSLVPEARSYDVEIVSVSDGERTEETTRRTYFSLSDLEEGDYDIRVRSVNRDSAFSVWSETLRFHKNYETGLVYTLIENGTAYEVSRVGRAEGSLVIEDEYRGLPVTRIGAAAFRSSGRITSVVLGKNVREIGDNAFYNCTRLVSATLPESVEKLGSAAFNGCSVLVSVNIPQAVTEIPDYAFAYCRALENISLHEGIVSIGESAFYGSALKEIVIPDTVESIGEYAFSTVETMTSLTLGSGITSIGEGAFRRCIGLSQITFHPLAGELVLGSSCFYETAVDDIELPAGTTEIGSSAFQQCASLGEITIPESVKKVGANAFFNTKLYAEQTAPGEDGIVYAGNWLVAVSPAGKEALTELEPESFQEGVVGIADQAFYHCPNLILVEIPFSVKHLGDYAFYDEEKLSRFVAERDPAGRCGLETVGEWCFGYCMVLRNVRFGTGLLDIGSYAFYQCSMLINNDQDSEVLVPSTVMHIGTYAFNATGVFNSPAEDGVVYAGNWVVGYDENMISAEVALRPETRGIADYAFFNNQVTRNISGLENTEAMGRGAFFGCANISQVTLGRGLRAIKEYTFYNCASLFRIGFPSRLESIERYAFRGCTSLVSNVDHVEEEGWDEILDLRGTELKNIDERAFSGCSSLRQVAFPDTLEKIGDFAFYGNVLMNVLQLPDSIKSIGHRSFAGCIFLRTIDFGEGIEEIGSYAFKDTIFLSSIQIPDSVREIGDYAFYNCGMQTVTLGSGLEKIGNYSFASSMLISIVIPESVVSVGKFAFRDCRFLRNVIFAGIPERIGDHAFYGCNGLTFYFGSGELSPATRWNSSYRPVIGNAQFTEGYVSSFTTGAFENGYRELTAPVREGYDFVGWSLTEGGEAQYSMQDIPSLEEGVTLYAVWEESKDEEPQVPDIPVSPKDEDEESRGSEE